MIFHKKCPVLMHREGFPEPDFTGVQLEQRSDDRGFHRGLAIGPTKQEVFPDGYPTIPAVDYGPVWSR